MKNILVNMLNVKSAGQMTYMINFLKEVEMLYGYHFTILSNIIAADYLQKINLCIPKNVRIYVVRSRFSFGIASYMWQVANLPRIVQEVKPDYVYAPTHIAYKVPNVKTILAMRNMAIPNFLKIDASLKMRFNLFLKYLPLRYCLRKADKVVAVSNYVKGFLQKNIGKDEKNIFVAYHLINELHKDDAFNVDGNNDISKNDFVVFIPGSYYPYKRFHALLSYLEDVNMPANSKIVFAGDEGDKKYLARLKQHKSNVHELIFKDRICIDEMKYFYKISKLVILSSQVEACPNIAIEALANKSKILASNIPPFKEILGDFAIYFDNNDKHDFGKKFHIAVSSIPKENVQMEQMKKISCSIVDVLNFCESV